MRLRTGKTSPVGERGRSFLRGLAALALSGQGDDRGQNDHGYDARFSQHGGYLLLIG